MYHLPEPARRLSAQILIKRPSILEWKNEQTEISWTSGWRLGLSHWLIGWLMKLEVVFSQSEERVVSIVVIVKAILVILAPFRCKLIFTKNV